MGEGLRGAYARLVCPQEEEEEKEEEKEERTQCEGARGYNVAGLRVSGVRGWRLREKRQKNGMSRAKI